MTKLDLSNDQRKKIIEKILQNSIGGKPKWRIMKKIASDFQVCRKTITDIWNTAKDQRDAGHAINVNSKLNGKVGRRSVAFDAERFKSICLKDRTTQHRVAAAMRITQTIVSKWVRKKVIKSHTNALKPSLTDTNKLNRLIFCLKHVHFDESCDKFRFNDQRNLVHIDEKWFYLTQCNQRYYLEESEPLPHRTIQSKKHIRKIMFMCAAGRPEYGANNEVIFDGKIGIFPFITQMPAMRNSRNRAAGTLETKPIDSITKPVIKECLINNVLPAIRAKWPTCRDKHIFIQQDNARPHIDNSDVEFREAATLDGINFELICQPPNSPELNVLDLGYFRAIQSLHTTTNAYKLDELVDAVTNAYDKLETIKLKYVFITLQAVMEEIMKRRGGNDYKLPHMHKSKLAAVGLLPEYLHLEVELIKLCAQHVSNLENFECLDEIVNALTRHAEEVQTMQENDTKSSTPSSSQLVN